MEKSYYKIRKKEVMVSSITNKHKGRNLSVAFETGFAI